MTARIGAMPVAEVFVCMWITICFHVVEAGLTCQIWRLLGLITLLVGWEETRRARTSGEQRMEIRGKEEKPLKDVDDKPCDYQLHTPM